jgi:long-subunit fatty acid transport protein
MNYTYTEQLATEGYGVNFRIGAIGKLGKVVRIGGSIETPTTYSLTDNFQSELRSQLRDPFETINSESPLGIFEYRVKTPWRYMASLATILKKRGLLTIQYEFANYRNGELKETNRAGSEADFSAANETIETNFRGRHTLRAGLELRASKALYFRGGVAYFSNPIPSNEFTDANLFRMQYSGGVGYRQAGWSLDMSYQFTTFDELYYTNTSANLSTLTYKFQTIALTLGIRI